MKKKLISAAFVVAIALTAGYNVYNSQNKVALSDLALDNVEALANGESGDQIMCYNGKITNMGGGGFLPHCDTGCSWKYLVISSRSHCQ